MIQRKTDRAPAKDPTGARGLRQGFTLVEVLVVIAIIGVLMALLLPAVQNSRESARRTQCGSNLKQMALGAQMVTDVKGRYPSGVDQSYFAIAPVYRGTSVFVQILPYMEQRPLWNQWEMSDPLMNTQGGASSRTAVVLPWNLCPSDSVNENPIQSQSWIYALTSYGGNGGTRSYPALSSSTDGIFHTTGPASEPRPNQQGVRPSEVKDGLSQTLLFGERSHRDANFESFASAGWIDSLQTWGWWAPSGGLKAIGHVTMSAAVPINFQLPFAYAGSASASQSAAFQTNSALRLNAWGSAHPGGANFVFADGSVRFLKDSLSLPVLQAVSTRKGGEIAKID
jgi:prepilin-type N-terminal cleavage/methylation domain-containing protein/prepilin-type processing-associated H-X9-DG protein